MYAGSVVVATCALAVLTYLCVDALHRLFVSDMLLQTGVHPTLGEQLTHVSSVSISMFLVKAAWFLWRHREKTPANRHQQEYLVPVVPMVPGTPPAAYYVCPSNEV